MTGCIKHNAENNASLEDVSDKCRFITGNFAEGLNFPDKYFDLIWEAGVVQIIGFKESFEACHRILKDGGYLVLGQAIKAIDNNNENKKNWCKYKS